MSNTAIFTNTTVIQQPIPLERTHAQKISTYYRFHAKIYDLTRWTFLFGRHWLIDWLPFGRMDTFRLLEVGCGTGHNLHYLAKNFPKARLIGMDGSADMLTVAQEKLGNVYNKPFLVNSFYGKPSDTEGVKDPNVILFSYCLTMVNPNWDSLILQAKKDLSDGGYIAVVDFHQSQSSLFKKWMSKNHVRMDGHILPFLQDNFETVKYEVRWAYFGLWHYTLYIGKKKS